MENPRVASWTARLIAPGLCLLAAAGGTGCRSRKPVERPHAAMLDVFPARTATVVSVDFAAFRASSYWQRLIALAGADPSDAKSIDELRARTGFDPFTDVDRMVIGFPYDARVRGEFGLQAFGRHLDERKLVAFAREQAGLRGTDLKPKEHAGLRLWAGTAMTDAAGFFVGADQIVLGRGGWAEEIAERLLPTTGTAGVGGQPAGAAGVNRELAGFIDRVVGSGRPAAWLASVVPADLRRQLARDPRFQAASAVNRWGMAIDIAHGLRTVVTAELSTAEDAVVLSRKVEELVRAVRGNPRVLLLGVGPFLDGVTAKAVGPELRLSLAIADRQVGDLLDRLAVAMRLARRGGPAAGPPR